MEKKRRNKENTPSEFDGLTPRGRKELRNVLELLKTVESGLRASSQSPRSLENLTKSRKIIERLATGYDRN